MVSTLGYSFLWSILYELLKGFNREVSPCGGSVLSLLTDRAVTLYALSVKSAHLFVAWLTSAGREAPSL